jgi:sigma-B regulation protein RsbU (phosphoserine phosphatase)
LPLGMFCEVEFSATRLQMEAGDTMFLYTDGLSEASNTRNEYGVERVTHLVRQQSVRSPAELIAACLEDLRAFEKGEARFDDLTLLAIRRDGQPANH